MELIDPAQIAEMRKGGQLDAAYDATLRYLDKYPDDRQCRLAHGKSVKALMERAAKRGDLDGLLKGLAEYGALRLDEAGDPEAGNKAAWDVRAFVNARRKGGTVAPVEMQRIFDALRPLHFIKPHRYYSVLLDTILSVRDEKGDPWPGIVGFIDWWGLENLLPEDFRRVRLTNGVMIPSIAERAYSAYYQVLKDELEQGRLQQQAASFVEKLDELLASNGGFQHTLYHKARLLVALDRTEEALTVAADCVRRRPDDFWSWAMLGDVAQDPDRKLGCYCRALTSRTDARFLGRVKTKAARLMAERGDLSQARCELDGLGRLYGARGWNIPQGASDLMAQPWYETTEAAYNNRDYYTSMAPLADSLLYTDVPEVAVMITSINPQKQTASFVTADQRRGFFSMRKLDQRFGEYQIYRMRFDGEIPESAPARVVTCERETEASKYEGIFYRRESGQLKWRPGQAYGFVGSTFVDGRLLGPWAETGMEVELTAAVYWHLKSSQWAWKAVTIRPLQ